jgi:hypothetical protein
MCKKAILAIRSIGRIKKYLSHDNVERVVNAFVTPHLHYCNSLLYGLPNYEIDKLQRVQNIADRLVSRARKYDYITPVLKDLHWLPVVPRINYKILLLVYKTLHGLSPTYLSSLVAEHQPRRQLYAPPIAHC